MCRNLIRNAVDNDFPHHNRPVSDFNPDHSKGWSFSFKYFKQVDYFGLKSESINWFASLLDRLQDLCSINPDEFSSNHEAKKMYRFHPIDWGARNIPVNRERLDWIDKDILENDDEFPFYQFQISKGNGRIIGFWGKQQSVFNVVFLDPKHNMQPAGGRYNYRVDKTQILPCKYTSLLTELDRLKTRKCSNKNCTFVKGITELQKSVTVGNFVYFQLDDEFYQEFMKKTENRSITEIVEEWIIS